ncbi:hypothetical protein VTI74DRAFT_4149 [Chaetomium olivicolor]
MTGANGTESDGSAADAVFLTVLLDRLRSWDPSDQPSQVADRERRSLGLKECEGKSLAPVESCVVMECQAEKPASGWGECYRDQCRHKDRCSLTKKWKVPNEVDQVPQRGLLRCGRRVVCRHLWQVPLQDELVCYRVSISLFLECLAGGQKQLITHMSSKAG